MGSENSRCMTYRGFEGNMIHIGWQCSHSKDARFQKTLKSAFQLRVTGVMYSGRYQVIARSLFVILKSGMIVCTMFVSGHQHTSVSVCL